MHPFLYRFMPSLAASTPRNLGEYPNLPEGQPQGRRHPYQSLKAAMKLLIFLRF